MKFLHLFIWRLLVIMGIDAKLLDQKTQFKWFSLVILLFSNVLAFHVIVYFNNILFDVLFCIRKQMLNVYLLFFFFRFVEIENFVTASHRLVVTRNRWWRHNRPQRRRRRRRTGTDNVFDIRKYNKLALFYFFFPFLSCFWIGSKCF